MEGRRCHLPAIPENYVSLRHLHEKRLKEKEEEEQRRRRLIEQEEEERKKLADAVEGLVLGGSGDWLQRGMDRTAFREVRVSEGEEGVPVVASARKMRWTKKCKGRKKGDGALALVVAGDGEPVAIGACTADSAAPGVKTKAGGGAKARWAAPTESKIGGGGEGEEACTVVGKGEEGRREAKGRGSGRPAKPAVAAVGVGENGEVRGWAVKGEEVRTEARGKGRGRPLKSAVVVGEEGGESQWAEKGEEGRSEAKRQGRGRPEKSAAATATATATEAVVGEKGGGRGWAKKGGGRWPRRGDEVGLMWVPK